MSLNYPVIIEGRNLFKNGGMVKKEKMRASGFKYKGVGI